MGSLLLGALVAASGCGFGTYDGTATPQVTGATDGVPDAGQWWTWTCPNGSNPAPASDPVNYAAAGNCSDGGTLALSVNGCEMEGNWDVLGLSNVSTNVSTSIPGAGGWEVAGIGGGDGGVARTCDATAAVSGVLTVTCTEADGGVAACTTTLTPERK